VRLFEPTLRAQQLATAGLAAVEGLLAIVLADAFNVGPGPTMAVIGALVYAAAALAARGAVRPRFAAAARRRAAA
jgi:manganese/iron transport system permease protein